MTNIQKPNKPAFTESLTPCEIVDYLNRYIVGQDKAKRAVAVALRTRWRRLQLTPDLSDEIIPKNILIIGPTGVGKTEIARRIAKLTKSPFMKVEASKFTEVGYVGRDVESIIRDLTEVAVNIVRSEHRQSVREKAEIQAQERLLDILYPRPIVPAHLPQSGNPELSPEPESYDRTRQKLREQLLLGHLDERVVEIEVKENFGGMIEVFSSSGIEEIGMQLKEMMPGAFNQKKKRRKMTVAEARVFLAAEEEDRLVDMDKVIQDAIHRVENNGIVFIDEIDKIAGKESSSGPDVSREGVQRDLLPIIEGSTVNTKYGMVRTDHILFIGSGAFHVTKPSDLIPELQGRFPVKVDVQSLTREQMRRILVEPENALVKQYKALLRTEKVELNFTDDAIESIAALAEEVNENSENIGARRLHTIMELLLEEVSFHAPSMENQTILINKEYVETHVTAERIIYSENTRKRRPIGFKLGKKSNET